MAFILGSESPASAVWTQPRGLTGMEDGHGHGELACFLPAARFRTCMRPFPLSGRLCPVGILGGGWAGENCLVIMTVPATQVDPLTWD